MKNYKNFVLSKVFESSNKMEVYAKLEEFVYFFVERAHGADFKIYQKSKSHRHGKSPFGVFISKNGNLPGLTIFRKEMLGGFIYNTISVKKLASFLICEETIADPIPEIPDYTTIIALEGIKINEWADIHESLQKEEKNEK